MVNYSSSNKPKANQGQSGPIDYNARLAKALAAAGVQKNNPAQTGKAANAANQNSQQNPSGSPQSHLSQCQAAQAANGTAPLSPQTGSPSQAPQGQAPVPPQYQPQGQNPATQVPAPNANGQPQQQGGQNAQPGQPGQPGQNQPGNSYQNKLQAILAAAGGQKPISQPLKTNSVLAKATAALNALKLAAAQDPSKILSIEDMEFDPNDGCEDIHLKCAGQSQSGTFLYDIFGCDIEHMLPGQIVSNYEAVPVTYYRNIPEDVLLAEFAKASGMGGTNIF